MNYGKKGVRRRQQSLTSRSTKIAKMLGITAFKIILLGILTVGVVGLCAGVGLFKGVLDSSPELSVLDLDPSGFSTAVYDSEGNQITTLVAADSNRKYQTIEKIPLDLQHAFVAIEDERFYEHNGIDIKGIVRAAFVGLRNGGRFTEGASTITQQLLKNNVFKGWTDESTFAERLKRKIQEQYLAIEVEKTVQNKDLI
ncbi:glycosyl transferase, partial [bacterium 1XD42-8]